MNSRRYKQIKAQFNIYAPAQQLDVKVSHLTNDRANTQTAFEQRKCTSPRTFSQKLYQLPSYQFHALEIAEEFEQALESQSLSKIKELLDKILEKNPDS